MTEHYPWSVYFYKFPNGGCPTDEFLDSLDSTKDLPFVINRINQLRKLGNVLRKPYTEHLRGDIYELRCRSQSGIFRLLFFFQPDHMIVITHGFTKKTQTTPNSEIEKAIAYQKDHLRQQKENKK